MSKVCTGVRLLPEEIRKREAAKARGLQAKRNGWNCSFTGPKNRSDIDMDEVERDRIDRTSKYGERVIKGRW